MSLYYLYILTLIAILVSFYASVLEFFNKFNTRLDFNFLSILKNINFLKLVIFLFSILIFFYVVVLWVQFDSLTFHKLKFTYLWNQTLFGVDSISLLLLLLTAFIVVIAILVNWNSSQVFFSFFNIFLLQFFIFLAFTTTDFFIFFLSFEGTLLPMLALLGIFGMRSRRIYALYSLFLYTLISSFALLIAIFSIFLETGSTSYLVLKIFNISDTKQYFLWICFFIAFATKLPLIPFHLWLPEAHVEAPTVGSILLASLLLKLGGYGFIRFMVLPLPEANNYFMPFISAIGLVSLFFSALSAIRQVDLKRIIAYSSISHMSASFLGIFSGQLLGVQGGVLVFLSHGITSTALFFLAGVIYSRFHSRYLWYFGGLAVKMPLTSVFFFVFMCANCSLPGTFNFIAELFIFVSLFQITPLVALISTVVFIFTAVYSIGSFNKIFFGVANDVLVVDLTWREFFILSVLFFFTIFFGFFTWIFTEILIDFLIV